METSLSAMANIHEESFGVSNTIIYSDKEKKLNNSTTGEENTDVVNAIKVKKWETSYEQRVVYGPYVIDGLYLFVYSDSSYVIVDNKGALIKNGRFGNFQLMSKPLLENKNMYFTSSNGAILNYDFSLMKAVWQTSIGLASSSNLYMIDTIIMYSNPSGEVIFLYKKSGTVYKKEIFKDLVLEPMSDGQRVILVTKDGVVTLYQISKNSIEIIKKIELPHDFIPVTMHFKNGVIVLEAVGKKYKLIEDYTFVDDVIENIISLNDTILYSVNGVYYYRTNAQWVKVSKNKEYLQINGSWGIRIKNERIGIVSDNYSDEVDYNGSELFVDKKALVLLNEKKSIILWGLE